MSNYKHHVTFKLDDSHFKKSMDKLNKGIKRYNSKRKLNFMLSAVSNSRLISLVAVLEMAVHSLSYILESNNAKWHFIGWLLWLIIITSIRFYYNRSIRFL